MDTRITRRTLMARALAGAALVAGGPEPPLPSRPLGATGLTVPILGFGTAPAGDRCTLREAVELYERALAMGVRYFDTAPGESGYGRAQEQLGAALAGRRSDAIVVTKCWNATADAMMRSLEASLREMRTGYADIVLAHSLGTDRMPLRAVLGRDGVMAGLRKAKRAGLARHIGVSGHHRPWKFVKLMATTRIEVMMNAVNLADQHTYGFERNVWPEARRRGVGLVAMKVFGGQYGVAKSSARMPADLRPLALRYALGLPGAACAVVGMATLAELAENVALASAFTPLTPAASARADAAGRALAAAWRAHFGAVR